MPKTIANQDSPLKKRSTFTLFIITGIIFCPVVKNNERKILRLESKRSTCEKVTQYST